MGGQIPVSSSMTQIGQMCSQSHLFSSEGEQLNNTEQQLIRLLAGDWLQGRTQSQKDG